jgi:hypothetical protein
MSCETIRKKTKEGGGEGGSGKRYNRILAIYCMASRGPGDLPGGGPRSWTDGKFNAERTAKEMGDVEMPRSDTLRTRPEDSSRTMESAMRYGHDSRKGQL